MYWSNQELFVENSAPSGVVDQPTNKIYNGYSVAGKEHIDHEQLLL